MENTSYPSIYKLQCPKCGKKDFKIIGTKGSKGAAIGMGLALGAVGNMIASSNSKSDFEIKPVQYQCLSCKNKFEALPLNAEADELLERPCTVTLKRLSSFVGIAVSQQVFLNSVKMGNVANNSEITFTVYTKYNTVFVTDQYGVVMGKPYSFTANSGESVVLRFKRKFV